VSPPLIVVSGLAREAAIAAGPGIVNVVGGGNGQRLARLLDEALAGGARGVLSFGIAGGVAPGLAPGSLVIAESVVSGEDRFATDPAWRNRLAAALPQASVASIAGIERPAADRAAKRAFHETLGVVAVDMESHIAARLAAARGLPFAVLRAVADPAERNLPPAALIALKPDGTPDLGAVLLSLMRSPAQLPGLLRLAFDARAAFAALGRARGAIGEDFGLKEGDDFRTGGA
jgi:adenosylhomocysteine nucleosidase